MEFHIWQNGFAFDVVTFEKMRKSRRRASFLISSKIEEVLQNCFCLTLSSSKIEEVKQNCFVFKLADCRLTDR